MQENYQIFPEKKLPRVRRYATLGAIRREVLQCYEELRSKPNADPVEIQRARALGYLLGLAGELMKAEKLDSIERRLDVLEAKNKEYVHEEL